MKPQLQQAVFRIQRFNPEQDEKPHYQTFQVNIDNRMTVLDALEMIKHEQDASLTFRRSCRSGICGSCAMRINGLAKLACKTRAISEAERHGETFLEPMSNMGLIKDLAVDMTEFWHEINRGVPWLIWNPELAGSVKENLVTDKQQSVSGKLADCIMCGCCFSDCVSRVFDRNFNGPASLAKIHRFVADPRDMEGVKRVHGLVDIGLWSCTHCYFCWSQCPRDVRPVAAISTLRALSHNAGDKSQGARHVDAFKSSVESTGMLNEAMLYLKTMGVTTLRDFDLILRMTVKGKAPPLLAKRIPKIDEVRTLFRIAKEESGQQ